MLSALSCATADPVPADMKHAGRIPATLVEKEPARCRDAPELETGHSQMSGMAVSGASTLFSEMCFCYSNGLTTEASSKRPDGDFRFNARADTKTRTLFTRGYSETEHVYGISCHI